jgi:hypothetical protein
MRNRRDDQTRFLVTGPARTGSTMLIWFLQSHPDLCAHGEVLAPQGPLTLYGIDYRLDPPLDDILRGIRERDPVGFLRDFVWQPGRRRAAGFKGKYEELLRPEYTKVLDHIRRETDILVLHIWRENLLERYLSQHLAVKVYGVYNVTKGRKRPPEQSVRLSPEECESDFRRTEARRGKFVSWMVGHPVLDVSYEELVGSESETLGRIQTFLGVEQRPLETKTVRMRTRTVRDTIENYDELEEFFRGTDYARFFKE